MAVGNHAGAPQPGASVEEYCATTATNIWRTIIASLLSKIVRFAGDCYQKCSRFSPADSGSKSPRVYTDENHFFALPHPSREWGQGLG